MRHMATCRFNTKDQESLSLHGNDLAISCQQSQLPGPDSDHRCLLVFARTALAHGECIGSVGGATALNLKCNPILVSQPGARITRE